MNKSKYFYSVLLLLLSALVLLVSAGLKLGHVSGWGVLLMIGTLSQLAGVVWFLVALRGATRRQAELAK